MQTIFITGASSGMGRGAALYFAQHGWQVIATVLKEEEQAQFKDVANLVTYQLDVTDPAMVDQVAADVLKKYDVDVLFNNAGYGMTTNFEDMTEDMMERSLDTNVLGMARVTKAFIPHFKEKHGGLILTTTSLAGSIALPFGGMYNADKWATTGLSETLYYELRPYNVRVRTFVPGAVYTSFLKNEDTNEVTKNPMQANMLKALIPDDIENMEQVDEAVADIYTAVTDDDPNRMTYVTGKAAQDLYAKRQEMGDESFRKYFAKQLMAQ